MRGAIRTVGVLSTYIIAAIVITAIWVYCARTEYDVDRLDVVLPSGQRYSARFNSVVRLAAGKAFAPFNTRRLLADAARGLAAVVPDRMWAPARSLLSDYSAAPGWARTFLSRQQWKAEDCPVVFCAYFLIACSVLGFMLVCRWLVHLLYHAPAWVADLVGLLMGVALLGVYSDWHYCGYPYDFPNAFVFALALAGLLARRWWFVLAFAAATWSKETSILLLAAVVLVAPRWRSRHLWGRVTCLVGLYASIRYWIELHYRSQLPEGGFTSIGRNVKEIAILFFSSWCLPFYGVGLARMIAMRQQFPRALARLSWLLLPLVGIAFFKGWIEEMRQYLEMLPVVGLLLVQWCLHEAGLGHLLMARGSSCTAAMDGAGPVRVAA